MVGMIYYSLPCMRVSLLGPAEFILGPSHYSGTPLNWTLIKPESSLYWTLFSAPKSLSYIFSIFNLSKPEPLTSRNRTLLSARNHLLIKKLTLLNRM